MLTVEKRLDKLTVWKQRVQHRLTYQQIADLHKVSPQAVHQACQAIEHLIADPDEAKAYDGVRADLLNAVEHKLVASLVDPAKIEKASLNNVAYAMTQVSQLRRLETGQSTQNLSVLSKLIESADAKLYPASALSKSDPLLSQNHESARQPSEEA